MSSPPIMNGNRRHLCHKNLVIGIAYLLIPILLIECGVFVISWKVALLLNIAWSGIALFVICLVQAIHYLNRH